MAVQQPNLPNYQLRELPDYAGMIRRVSATGVAAMQQLAINNEKKKAAREKLIKESDAVENNFNELFANKEKSGIVQADAANRKWAGGVAKDLNLKYQDAYGSTGTPAKREIYKTANAEAMEKLNQMGVYATMIGLDNQAITLDKQAREQGTNVGLMTPNSMYKGNAQRYGVATQMNNGTATNMKTYNNSDNNHLMISYNVLDENGKLQMEDDGITPITVTDDIFASVNTFNQTKKGLSAYSISEEQDLQEKGYNTFKERIVDPGLLNTTGIKVTKTVYDKRTGKFKKVAVIDKESFYEAINKGDENSEKLNKALNGITRMSDFNTQFFQLNNNGYNTDGKGVPLPLTEVPWGIGNMISKEEFTDLQATQKDDDASTADVDESAQYTYDGEIITDPTPEDKLTRDDLNDIQQQSAKMMLVSFYNDQSPEGEEEQAITEKIEYEKDTSGAYTAGQRNKFEGNRNSYNAVIKHSSDGTNKYGKIYEYNSSGEPTTNKLTSTEAYADYLNQIRKTQGSTKHEKFMTGKEVNATGQAGINNNPDQIYRVTYKTGGQIGYVDDTNFNKDDLDLQADAFYNNVMAEWQLDSEVQAYFDANISPE
jgi:hypothetical protein